MPPGNPYPVRRWPNPEPREQMAPAAICAQRQEQKQRPQGAEVDPPWRSSQQTNTWFTLESAIRGSDGSPQAPEKLQH